MPITKPCVLCKRDARIENLTCADSKLRVPDCKIHGNQPESVPGCDEVYCETCWGNEINR